MEINKKLERRRVVGSYISVTLPEDSQQTPVHPDEQRVLDDQSGRVLSPFAKEFLKLRRICTEFKNIH